MSWHYQVMRHVHQSDDGSTEVWFGIHEYYDLPDIGVLTSETLLSGESVEDLKEQLKMMEQDIYRYGVKDYD